MERAAAGTAALIELYEPGDIPEAAARSFPMGAAYIRQFAGRSSRELIRNVETQ